MPNQHLSQQRIITLAMFAAILVGILVTVYGFKIGWGRYNRWTKVDDALLLSTPWIVEASGYYNYVAFFPEGEVEVFDYPRIIQKGVWRYENGSLKLKFTTDIPDREYVNLKFDRFGVLHSLIDANEERWLPAK